MFVGVGVIPGVGVVGHEDRPLHKREVSSQSQRLSLLVRHVASKWPPSLCRLPLCDLANDAGTNARTLLGGHVSVGTVYVSRVQASLAWLT